MTIATEADLAGNQLLAILQEADLRRLQPHLLALDLAVEDTLQAAGENVVHTWFPTGASLASFCVGDQDGEEVEVALIGREGAIGGIVSNGDLPAFATARVRRAGRFLRIRTQALEQAKRESIALRYWFARYSDCLFAQVFQTAVCNATHTLSQRAAKWLLAATTRTGKLEFAMTQAQFAHLLGVGRPFVTRIIGQFRSEGILSTRRGLFTVLDEGALRARACNCTAIIENHFDAVLHGIYAT